MAESERSKTLPGILSPRLVYLADEHRDHVHLAVGSMPGAVVEPRVLLGAARTLLSQVPLNAEGPLRAQDVHAIEQAIALAMLALK